MQNNVHRILLVDDNISIHEDFSVILKSSSSKKIDANLESLEDDLFSDSEDLTKSDSNSDISYLIDNAYQADEAIKLVDKSVLENNPYSLVFMDVRMPPGMDGIQATKNIWRKHPTTQIIICTAFSDYSWDELLEEFGQTDKLLFLRKPFDSVTVKQLALTLSNKYEADKQNANRFKEIEEKVTNRTLELNSMVANLNELKIKAEDATKVKGQFLSNMSHEIRSPLNGILGMSELLLDTTLNQEQIGYAESIKTSGDALLTVINDILDFSKIESGKIELEELNFNIKDLLKNIIDIGMVNATKKNLNLELNIDSNIPNILKGDSGRFRQILLNLMSNSIKFTQTGTIAISIELNSNAICLNNEISLLIKVSDTGIGMSDAEISKLFTPFQQADASTTRKFGGTGLGLSISKQLCILMGGDINVKSSPNTGSTFSFFLSLKTIDEDNSSKSDKLDDSLNNFIVDTKIAQSFKVLVAEDNLINQKIISKILSKIGINCDTATNGLKAYQATTKKDYNLIFMDCLMPVMDGFESTKKIRQDSSIINKPIIIAATADAFLENKKKCLECGMDDFLSKPYTSQQIIDLVKKYIKKDSNE